MIFVVSIQNIISFAQSESNGKLFDHDSQQILSWNKIHVVAISFFLSNLRLGLVVIKTNFVIMTEEVNCVVCHFYSSKKVRQEK